jgi:hypothetical protein
MTLSFHLCTKKKRKILTRTQFQMIIFEHTQKIERKKVKGKKWSNNVTKLFFF